MKKLFQLKSIKYYAFILVLNLLCMDGYAQLVSSNAFLKGNFIEVGMAPCGSFGSSVDAPAGYNPRGGGGRRLGFVADPAKDGFNVGSPDFVGDYFLPGSPEEGWGLTINGVNYNNNQVCSQTDISGSITNYNSTSTENSATWTGSIAGLSISAKSSVLINSVYFTTTVKLKNTSSTTINNIFYMRNVDPDHGVFTPGAGGNYVTTNCVVNQNPNSTNKALVSATVAGHFLGLGSLDARAKVTHGGFSNRSAIDVWNGNGLNTSGCATDDAAISIAFKVGSLAPGEEATFSYVYVLDETQLDEGLAATLGAVKNITCNSATFFATSTKNGTGYYIVVPRNSSAPTANEIKNGVNYGSTTVVKKGSATMIANVENSFDIADLSNGTSYDIYFVSQDAASEFSSISKVQFATRALTTWYQDSDGDGFGNSAISVTTCDQPVGYVNNGNDCNDSNINVNPSATEIVRNGIDDNCNGVVDELVYTTPEVSITPCIMYIENVSTSGGVTNFNNSSACSSTSFEDFSSSQSVSQIQGQSITMNFTSSGYPLNYVVWVDFNDDGTFSSSEQVITTTSYDNTFNRSELLTIPATAPVGAHRMRVRGEYAYSSLPSSPTSKLEYGETEDYTLLVISANQAPVAVAKALTLSADANCQATATAVDFDGGSTDADGDALTYSVAPAGPYVIGTTSVVLTVTDTKGASSSSSATVTVEDTTLPTAIAQNLTVALVNGSASITAEQINNGSFDNCGIASISIDKTSFTCSNVGNNTVTLTVTDVNGNISSKTATVIVEDKIAPIVLTQNRTIQLDATGNTTITAADINNGSSDNCGIASVVLDKTSFTCSNVGNNTVTLTITDVNGNLSTSTAVVTVEDKVAPIVFTQNLTIQLNASGNAFITPSEVNNNSTDNCGIASYTLSKTAFDCSNVGANTVTLTVTDVNGNVSTATATITVEDKIAPIITQLAFQEICFVASNTYSLPTLTATDNCSVASVKYVLSGATNRTGTGTDASGIINTGLTTITWTVTDVNGNVSTSSNDVRIWPLPVVSITPSNADAFCNEVSLTPSSTIPAVSYRWMYNNTLFSTNAVLKLSIANADGNYQLFVTDIHGCVNTQIASYNFQKQGAISSYTILGIKEVKLGENNKVLSGSVGAMGYKGKIDIKKNSSVAGTGAFVKAQSIKISSPSNVPTKIYAPVVTTLPTMQYFTGSTKNLAKVTASSNTTLTGNYKELTVKAGKTVTLTGSLFGKVEIEEGATVTFTSSVINIQNLEVEGSETKSKYTPAYTQVIFITDAIVKVSDKVDIEDRSNINPTGKKVIFYVGSMKDHGKYNSNSHDDDDRCPSRGNNHNDDDDDDDDDDDYGSGEFKVEGGESIVNASVYAPTGKIKVSGGEKTTTNMTGMFIAEKVEGNEKNVNWNGFSCSAPVQMMATNSVMENASPALQIETASLELAETKFLAYPNPFARQTTVTFTLPYQEDNTTIDIYDLRGVKVQTIFRGKAAAQTPTEVQFNGQNIAAGTYFFRLTTGKEVKNFKVVMSE